MKKNLKNKLEKALEADLKEFDKVKDDIEVRSKRFGLIEREVKLLNATDKNESDILLNDNRINNEKSRTEQDEKRLIVEDSKLTLERERFEYQKTTDEKKVNADYAEKKRTFGLGIAGIVVPSLLTLVSKVIFAGLAINAQRHEYKDYVLEPSSSKEQRNNLLK